MVRISHTIMASGDLADPTFGADEQEEASMTGVW